MFVSSLSVKRCYITDTTVDYDELSIIGLARVSGSWVLGFVFFSFHNLQFFGGKDRF